MPITGSPTGSGHPDHRRRDWSHFAGFDGSGPPHGFGGAWQRRPGQGFFSPRLRLWFPVVVSLLVQLPAALFVWRAHNPGIDGAPAWFLPLQLGIAVAGPLALIAARRFPGPVVAAVALLAALDLFVGGSQAGPPYIALAFAIIGAVARGARLWAWVAVAAGWVASITLAVALQVSWPPVRIASTTLGILVIFGVAEGIRSRKERFEQFGRIATQRRQSEVQAERVRIARELHDVLAHSLSQINVQAGVGLHLMESQPEKAREALASIKTTSKSALDEVRSVLGVLRAESEGGQQAPLLPEPDLSRIPGLAASVTAQGIEVTVSGELTGVPQATQLAIYRIVQESLTNVARHSGATHARVELAESGGFYSVTVSDDGTAGGGQGGQPTRQRAEAGSEPEGGRGLLGMRERAELLGGTLEAGPMPAGGFRVAARLPAKRGGQFA